MTPGPARLQEGRDELILEPELAIVDTHHHFYDNATTHYMFEQLLDDVRSGHRVTATVYVATRTMMRSDGPVELRPLGEVEFANGIAAQSASGNYGKARVCAAILGAADLAAPQPELEALLDRCMSAAPERFRGIRQSALEAPSADTFQFSIAPVSTTPGLLKTSEFRAGLRTLAARGLTFDTSVFHNQLPDLARLADDVPEATIVVDHMGIALGYGLTGQERAEVFTAWRDALAELSRRPNVICKVGGLGMPFWGFGFETRSGPIGYRELADAWSPYVETAVAAFGPQRCMLESNYPPDGRSAGYVPLWNAYKAIFAGYSPAEKAAVFHDTAARVYRIDDDVASYS